MSCEHLGAIIPTAGDPPCVCGCAAQDAQMQGFFGDWGKAVFADTAEAPAFDCKDPGAVAAYLNRAVTTNGIRYGFYGFLAGGIAAALILTAWRSSGGTRSQISRFREKAIDRAGDVALDRYLPRGR